MPHYVDLDLAWVREAQDRGGDLGFGVKVEVNENHLIVPGDKHVHDVTLAAIKQVQNATSV